MTKKTTTKNKKNSNVSTKKNTATISATQLRRIQKARHPLWFWPLVLILLAAIVYLLYSFTVTFYSQYQRVQKLERAQEYYR